MSQRIEPEVQLLLDKAELAELLAELSSAVDRGDHDRIAACYTEDSYDDHGTFKGSGQQFAAFIRDSRAMSGMHHLLGQSVFEVKGDEAWGETFYVFHGAIGPSTVSACGRYVDYFRRLDGTWKLAYRRVVPDTVPAGDDATAYSRPTRSRDDPSYDRARRPDDVARPSGEAR